MLVLLSLACTGDPGGNFLDGNLRCAHDVYGWFDDLTLYVDRGEPKQGASATYAFDFEYEPGNVKSVKGSYSTRSGNFDYAVEYTADSWMVSRRTDAEFSNYGTVYTNGNLDVRAKIVEEDVLGEITTYVRRDERKGCQGWTNYRWQDDEGNLPRYPEYTVRYEITSADKVEWTAEDEISGAIESSWGHWSSDLSYVRNTSYDGNSIAYDTWSRTDATGAVNGEWSQVDKNSNRVFVGTRETAKNGFSIQDYSVSEGNDAPYAEVHSERNYDGSGTGTWSFTDGLTCDVVYENWDQCSYSCSDGETGTDC